MGWTPWWPLGYLFDGGKPQPKATSATKKKVAVKPATKTTAKTAVKPAPPATARDRLLPKTR
jgi:hypothetical protein